MSYAIIVFREGHTFLGVPVGDGWLSATTNDEEWDIVEDLRDAKIFDSRWAAQDYAETLAEELLPSDADYQFEVKRVGD